MRFFRLNNIKCLQPLGVRDQGGIGITDNYQLGRADFNRRVGQRGLRRIIPLCDEIGTVQRVAEFPTGLLKG
jgi:hypothetical protein